MRTFSTIKKCDYLVVGGGAMGLAFTDELTANQPNAKVVLVDNRSRVGGHWNSAYDFVGLHQPSHFYGVNSVKLQKTDDPLELASKTEVLDYFQNVVEKLEVEK
jgi:cation diffusion facilitator CzcD-associated flavoprotein CzcO